MEDSSTFGGSTASSNAAGGGRVFRGERPRFGGTRPFRPSPVRVGEEYDVKIDSMSKRGDSGVARVQGLVIFVAGTKVGDSVKIRITKVGRGYAMADVVAAGHQEAAAAGQPTSAAVETAAPETAAAKELQVDEGEDKEKDNTVS